MAAVSAAAVAQKVIISAESEDQKAPAVSVDFVAQSVQEISEYSY